MSDEALDFQTVYETYRPKISRYLSRLVGVEEAADVTQEVFAKVGQGLESFRGESRLSTWVYRIATNAAIDRLRSPARKRTVMSEQELDCAEGLPAAEPPPGGARERPLSAGGQVIRKEMNRCIRDFVERLPDTYRTVLILSELEGLKNREVAEVLGLSLEAVKIRLHRARAKLREELSAHCTFYRDERDELACDLRQAFE